MDGRLCEAAITGDVLMLRALLQEDAYVLDRVSECKATKENPLHAAAQFGHLDFVTELVSLKPQFAHQLNSQAQSPLHLATEKGHLDIVRILLQTESGVCFIRDSNGRTPLHIAARRGRLGALEELVKFKSKAAWVCTSEGEPLLHFCANNNEFDALKMLVDMIEDKEFFKLKDNDDNTILHLLVAKQRYKETEHVLRKLQHESDVLNAMDANAATALDLANRRERSMQTSQTKEHPL